MESYVLTMIGADRAGLVEALAEVVAAHGGSWERSQFTELAGTFAGVVLVRIPEDRAAAFHSGLEPLQQRGLFDVTVRPAAGEDLPDDAPVLSLEVMGADRPGIVREVSARLASLDLSIVDLRTWTESAAMAGTPLFKVAAVVRLPVGTTDHDVTTALEDLSDDLMVDVVTDPEG